MKYLDIPVTTGVLIVTHVKTGKFYMTCSLDIRAAAIGVNWQCERGTYQNPKLQELYNSDAELDYTFIETKNTEDARSVRQSIQAKNYGNELCLNIQDQPKLSGVWELKHKPTGKLVLGITSDIIKQHYVQLNQLRTRTHKNPAFQELYSESTGLADFSFRFTVTDDKLDTKVVYDSWLKEAQANGVYLTARRGQTNDGKLIGEPNTCGMYLISFPQTGMFYVGSSSNLRNRTAQHKSFLKKGNHTCRALQEAYNISPEYTIKTFITDTIEEAINREQEYLDNHFNNPLCVNLANNAVAPCANLHENTEWHKRIVAAAARERRKPETRESFGKQMKEWHARPEVKAARMGGGNPFAKKIKMFGVEYGSVMDAIRTGILSKAIIRKRLKDPNDLELIYC